GPCSGALLSVLPGGSLLFQLFGLSIARLLSYFCLTGIYHYVGYVFGVVLFGGHSRSSVYVRFSCRLHRFYGCFALRRFLDRGGWLRFGLSLRLGLLTLGLADGRILATRDGDQTVDGLLGQDAIRNRAAHLSRREQLAGQLCLRAVGQDRGRDFVLDVRIADAEFFRFRDLTQHQRLLELALCLGPQILVELVVVDLLQ